MSTVRSEAHLQHSLNEVTRLLEKHRVLEAMTRRELRRRDLLETLQHRQNLAELQKRVRALHAADVADILEALPVADRRTVWQQIGPDMTGTVFLEVSHAVRESLVQVRRAPNSSACSRRAIRSHAPSSGRYCGIRCRRSLVRSSHRSASARTITPATP